MPRPRRPSWSGDPVYTGKAMAALVALVRAGQFRTGEQVVFWHTGGAPALLAYRDVFETGVPELG